MKKILALAVVATVLLAACSKDMKVVKELEGTWKVTDISVDGTSLPDSLISGQEYTFEKCNVKKEDCNGSFKVDDPFKGSVTTPFTYSISEKGTIFTINIELIPGLGESESSTITEHSDSKFVTEHTEDGEVTVTTMTK